MPLTNECRLIPAENHTGQPLEHFLGMYENYRPHAQDGDTDINQSTNQPMTVHYSIKTYHQPLCEEPFCAEIRVAIPTRAKGEAIPVELLSCMEVLGERLSPQWGVLLQVKEGNSTGFPGGMYRSKCLAFSGPHWEEPLREARKELGKVKSALHLIWNDAKMAERMPPGEYGEIVLGEPESND